MPSPEAFSGNPPSVEQYVETFMAYAQPSADFPREYWAGVAHDSYYQISEQPSQLTNISLSTSFPPPLYDLRRLYPKLPDSVLAGVDLSAISPHPGHGILENAIMIV